jgi:hypothetical protein
MYKVSSFLAIITCTICLIGIHNISERVFVRAQDSSIEHSPIKSLPIINQEGLSEQDTYDKISFKIKGIDYSTKIAQILVTIDGKTFAKNFDPISLLDPQDDGNGVIQFEMLIPKDAMKPGSTYTSCIKVLEDTDNYGTHLACQTGSTDEIHALSGENPQIYLKL